MKNKFILFILIFGVMLTWPERMDLIGLILIIFTTVVILKLHNNNFNLIFTLCFITSYINGLFLFHTTDKYGLFKTSSQDQKLGMSDSQFFLYISEEVVSSKNYEMLLWTWGSLIPTLYGSIILWIYKSYCMIIFFNSYIYVLSILSMLKIFNISELNIKEILLLVFMPLPIIYNSMLSKEPLFLLFLFFGISLINKITSIKKNNIKYNCLLFIISSCLLLFRPIGTAVLTIIYLFKRKLLTIFYGSILIAILLTFIVFMLNNAGYPIPIFFLNKGEIDLSPMMTNQVQLAKLKNIPEYLSNLIIPPYSLILFPLLLPIWFFGPIINFESFLISLNSIFTHGYSFENIINLSKYLDILLSSFLIYKILRKKLFLKKNNMYLLLVPLIIILFFIIGFQFLESSRHRYLITIFIFCIFVVINRPYYSIKFIKSDYSK